MEVNKENMGCKQQSPTTYPKGRNLLE